MLLLNGRTINQIADEYHLSIETIKKLSTLNESKGSTGEMMLITFSYGEFVS